MLETSLLLKKKAQNLPFGVGVYLFLDKKKTVLYVGKSLNIRKRVLSYFKEVSKKNRTLINSTFFINHVLVETEKDALFLENNLIKKHKPKYNILLKDDKTFPWICIKNERFPRVFITRKKTDNGDFYYGPFVSKKQLNGLFRLISDLYPVRSCNFNLSKKNIYSKKYTVCLDFYLKKCLGPCEGLQKEDDYGKNIALIKSLLCGNYSVVSRFLKKKLVYYSSNLLFEKANTIKTQLISLNNLKNKSIIISNKNINIDCFFIISFNSFSYINFTRVTEGSVVYFKSFKLKNRFFWDEVFVLENFINNTFVNYGFLHKQIITNISNVCFLGSLLKNPKIGYKKKLLNFSHKNLISFIDNNSIKNYSLLQGLKLDLLLKNTPNHIECFDVSTLGGENTVASCIVLKNGFFIKKEYRIYNIKSFKGVNDYLSIEEVLKRRYKKNYPDLIIIDGGKGHLNIALNCLYKNNNDIISIAKKEEIIYSKNNLEFRLYKKSNSLKFIQKIRNEAHRFCLKQNRLKKYNSFLKSDLYKLKGVGDKTFIKLIKNFKSFKNLKNVKKEDFIKLLGKKRGLIVFNSFNK